MVRYAEHLQLLQTAVATEAAQHKTSSPQWTEGSYNRPMSRKLEPNKLLAVELGKVLDKALCQKKKIIMQICINQNNSGI